MDKELFRDILREYGLILNRRSVDFFSANSFNALASDWKQYLRVTPVELLVLYVNSKLSGSECVPPSLKILKSQLEKLEYSRKCVQSPKDLWRAWTGTVKEDVKEEFQNVTSSNGLVGKRIKAKKQHEIDRIVELISQIQVFQQEKSDPIDSLVDIGAGVGHLSRIISLRNKLAVMAVEGNRQFTLAANFLDKKLLSAGIGSPIETTPIRFTTFVTEELSLKVDDFAANSAILVGLHCCGDFSSTILKVFLKSRKAKALVLFGCCYHKEFQSFHFLKTPLIGDGANEEHKTVAVFPLSQKWSDFELSYVLREAACHNNENLAKRYTKENLDISRYARAYLEKWIWQITNKPEDRNIGMCSVNCVENETTFEEYIRKAMAKRGNHLIEKLLEIIPKYELSTFVSVLRSSEFDSFDILKSMFAPAIESAITDDRLEFLRENGITAKVVPLFEPSISPRNLAIVAYK